MTPTTQPLEKISRLQRWIERIGTRTYFSVGYVSDSLLPGQFRSRHRDDRPSIDWDISRMFDIDDDPASLDQRSLGAAVQPNRAVRLQPLLRAAFQGELRVKQALLQSEAEFVAVIDSSRSLLSGWLVEDRQGTRLSARSKLTALHFAVCAFLSLAESARFTMRTFIVHGAGVEMLRTRSPKDFTYLCLKKMGAYLCQSYAQAVREPTHRETYRLREGLAAVRELHTRCIVVVISDFLDDLELYRAALTDLLARRQVVLVDVATKEDREFPPWKLWAVYDRRKFLRAGARHPEDGTEARCLPQAELLAWNTKRKADHRNLVALAKAAGAPFLPMPQGTFQSYCVKAMACLQRIR
jgi:hypothetical protein